MPMDKVIIDPSHLAEIMIDYIDNPHKVTEHSHNARQRIEQHFNWDDRDEQILNFLSI
jgi:glycosyltransferase involved in cell wall biosynthesis